MADVPALTDHQVRLADRPCGLPGDSDWGFVKGPIKGPSNDLSLLVDRARTEDIVVLDRADRYREAVQQIALRMGEGRFRSCEEVVQGLEKFPEAPNMLVSGSNVGRPVFRVADL